MQQIVIDKPYRFVPAYPREFGARLIGSMLPRSLKRNHGLASHELRGLELLRQSLAARHAIILAPNHCRPCDPLVMGLLCRGIDQPFYCMASWHLFMQGRVQRWLMRMGGAFSVYREGTDREALKTAINVLVEAKRPLILFPEGIISRANDRLGALLPGTSFIARSAAKQRAKATPPGKVVLHPIAIHYFFDGDLAAAVGPVLTEIETRLSWRPQTDLPLLDRIAKVGEALLALKEIEYMGRTQTGRLRERRAGLIERLLRPLEQEWLGGRAEPSVNERVKRLRTAILPAMAAGTISKEERKRRWGQLADIYLAQQVSCYPSGYLRSRPTAERLLETVERFEEDLTDKTRIYGPLRVVIQVGEAFEVGLDRDRGPAVDPLMQQLGERLQTMLDRLASESPVLAPSVASAPLNCEITHGK